MKKKYQLCWQGGRPSPTSASAGQRRSAVEMLQATKAFYVKSERVRGSNQQLSPSAFAAESAMAATPTCQKGSSAALEQILSSAHAQNKRNGSPSTFQQQTRSNGETSQKHQSRRWRGSEEVPTPHRFWWRSKELTCAPMSSSPVRRLSSVDIDDVQAQLRRLLTPSTTATTTTPPSVADSRSNERTDECGCHKSLPNISSGFESGGDVTTGGCDGYCDDVDGATDGDAVEGCALDRGFKKLVRRRRRSRRRLYGLGDSRDSCLGGIHVCDGAPIECSSRESGVIRRCASGTDESCSAEAVSITARSGNVLEPIQYRIVPDMKHNYTNNPVCGCDVCSGVRGDISPHAFYRNNFSQKPVMRSKSDIDRRKYPYESKQWTLGGSSEVLPAENNTVSLSRRCSFDVSNPISYPDKSNQKTDLAIRNYQIQFDRSVSSSTPLVKHMSFSRSHSKLNNVTGLNYQPFRRRRLERFFETSSGGAVTPDRLGVPSVSSRFHLSVSAADSGSPVGPSAGSGGDNPPHSSLQSFSAMHGSERDKQPSYRLADSSHSATYTRVYPGHDTDDNRRFARYAPSPFAQTLADGHAYNRSMNEEDTALIAQEPQAVAAQLTPGALMPMAVEPSVIEKNARIVKWLVSCRRSQGIEDDDM